MYFSDAEQQEIVAAIKRAEKRTSGEVKVHVEPSYTQSTIEERALELFKNFNLEKTAQRNGVLIYIAYKRRQFTIYGDQGINAAVESDFWLSVRQEMQPFFKIGDYKEGLIQGIEHIGEKLSLYFPYQKGDVNELSDDISFS